MSAERRARALLALTTSEGPTRPRLCSVSAQIVGVAGAGVTLMSDRGGAPVTVCASDRVAAAIEDLQFGMREGPCFDAYSGDRPVSEPDLAATLDRWPVFTPAAVSAGAASVFGFPLRVAGICIGAIDLYDVKPGPLHPDQFADALIAAPSVSTSREAAPVVDSLS